MGLTNQDTTNNLHPTTTSVEDLGIPSKDLLKSLLQVKSTILLTFITSTDKLLMLTTDPPILSKETKTKVDTLSQSKLMITKDKDSVQEREITSGWESI